MIEAGITNSVLAALNLIVANIALQSGNKSPFGFRPFRNFIDRGNHFTNHNSEPGRIMRDSLLLGSWGQ